MNNGLLSSLTGISEKLETIIKENRRINTNVSSKLDKENENVD
jgi:hypothetical protein